MIQTHFDSEVVNAHQDTFTHSYIEDQTTILEFDMRKRDYDNKLGIKTKVYWSTKTYPININEFSTFHMPIIYRFIVAQGHYMDHNKKRIYFTPTIDEVSAHQHVTNNVIHLSCYLSVICGVTLRNIATLFSVLFQIPTSKSSIKRWIDDVGDNLPSEEEILKQLVALKTPTQCHIDGYYPRGTNNCVMVIKDEYDRILITHETETENGEAAEKFLQTLKDSGINITLAFSDYAKSYTESIKKVFPHAKFQADHFHTAKNIWKHLKKSLLSYRRGVKSEGEEKKDDELLDFASELWKLRWILLKKPSNLSDKEKEKILDIEKKDSGFIKKFRLIIKQLENIFDYSSTERQAELKLVTLKIQIQEMENSHLTRIIKFFTDHWEQAMHYLKKRGLAKYPRASNSESGMRILRRLEKSHDGIRSQTTRKNYIKIYQTIKYLSIDVADFLDNSINNDLKFLSS